MLRNLRCIRYTAFFEQSIPVWNRLSYPTYVGIQYWQKVATKTPAATAMVGALPTINNQLKAAAAMAMEMTTATTHKT
jgi:hypothetical protein